MSKAATPTSIPWSGDPRSGNHPTLIAYIRVSTPKQGRSGLGLEAQQDAIRRFAEVHGAHLANSYVEVETGKGADALASRPVLRGALDEARRRGAKIVVAKLDRLSRDVHFISGLMAQQVPFVVAELGPDVLPFMLHIYAAVAQQEAAMTAQRTRDALRAAKARGVKLGSPNMDRLRSQAADAKREEADKFALSVIDEIAEIRSRAGDISLRAIAMELNRMKIKSANGGAWSGVAVAAVLKRIKGMEAE